MVIEHDSAYLDRWVNSVVKLWRSKGIRLESGATQTQLGQTQHNLSFHFDSAFYRLYQTVNGFEPFEWNSDMICIWSLPRIVEEFNTRRHPTFIGFADYLIGSHIYGFIEGKRGFIS